MPSPIGRTIKRSLVLAGVLAVVGTTAAAAWQATRPASADPAKQYRAGQIIPVATRHQAPHLRGTTIDGAMLDTATYAGHVLVINVWGSWCKPCRAEAPDLKRAAAETGYLGVHFIGIDVRDNAAQARAFESDFGITYPSLDDAEGAIVPQFGRDVTPAVPTTYVIDARGRIAAVFLGKITYLGLENDLVQIGHEPR